jgi:hypothetical protein
MPEIWVPFGSVETLVTIQAENLGQVVEQPPEKAPLDLGRTNEQISRSSSLFVCDSSPPTIDLLRQTGESISASSMKLFSSAPKKLESAVPDLRGRFATLPPPIPDDSAASPVLARELTDEGHKIFIGTARPDPLFGLVDARVLACLNWASGALRAAAGAREEMEPQPFQRTSSFDAIDGLSKSIVDPTFLTVVPSGGTAKGVLEDAPFDALKGSFPETQVSPARALIAGMGGTGFDDTLSAAIRGVWSVLPAVRRSGSVLIVSECSAGLGSPAIEMLATGRMAAEGRRKEKYVDGLEEVFYLNKLKQEYEILLLSGLPEIYAKGKLGLPTAKGSGEAVGRLLNKVGRTGKVNVVPRSAELRLIPS